MIENVQRALDLFPVWPFKHFNVEEVFKNDYEVACAAKEVDTLENIFKVLYALEDLRETIEKPIIINSFFRSLHHNREVGGAPHSQHLEGLAADIQVNGMSPLSVAIEAQEFFDTIIVYDTFTHCDLRGKKNHWQNINGKYIPINLEEHD